ncbi:hypothetical protein QZH41_002192 [Actinostola sp. cb2023]|nr:hypothetical protein QZH41_002192 [Actinostola sp. cb2023]
MVHRAYQDINESRLHPRAYQDIKESRVHRIERPEWRLPYVPGSKGEPGARGVPGRKGDTGYVGVRVYLMPEIWATRPATAIREHWLPLPLIFGTLFVVMVACHGSEDKIALDMPSKLTKNVPHRGEDKTTVKNDHIELLNPLVKRLVYSYSTSETEQAKPVLQDKLIQDITKEILKAISSWQTEKCVTCPSGPPGLTGPKGKVGLSGPKGKVGLSGPKGKEGLSGPKGKEGLSGPKGKVGLSGPKGKEGLSGPKGKEGLSGPKGKEGLSGPKGKEGLSGPKGKVGLSGPKGKVGLSGPKGKEGLSGPKGKVGLSVPKERKDCQVPKERKDCQVPKERKDCQVPKERKDCQVPKERKDCQVPKERSQRKGRTVSPKGKEGLSGPKGKVGLSGPKGKEGLSGPKGKEGLSGPKGKEGLSGPKGKDCQVPREGLSGPKGKEGLSGPKGKEGLSGPKGKEELSGPKGKEGLSGPKGKSLEKLGCAMEQKFQLTSQQIKEIGLEGDMQGPPGIKGDHGMVGIAGRPGVMGPPGLVGRSGSRGFKGFKGIMGRPGLPGAVGSRGSYGVNGFPGSPGPKGSPGLGEKGSPGEKGLPALERAFDKFRGYIDSRLENLAVSLQTAPQVPVESIHSSTRKLQREAEAQKLKYKANSKQFLHNAEVEDHVVAITQYLEKETPDAEQALETAKKAVLVIQKRQKLIKLADKSEAGWLAVQEYESDELADGSDDEKRIKKAQEKGARERKDRCSNKQRGKDRSTIIMLVLAFVLRTVSFFEVYMFYRHPFLGLSSTPFTCVYPIVFHFVLTFAIRVASTLTTNISNISRFATTLYLPLVFSISY